MKSNCEICILHESKSPRYFDVEEGYLSTKVLRLYYPAAVGLTYKKNGKEYCVIADDEKLKLIPGIEEYNTYCTDIVLNKSTSLTDKKREHLDDIIANIRNYEQPALKNELKKKSIGKKATTKERVLQISWKHRDSINSQYQKMQKPHGGNKLISLDSQKLYSVEDIKAIAIKSFKNDLNENYFIKSIIEIGTKDGDVIKNFLNDENDEGLWKYSSKICDKAHRLNLCLLTTFLDNKENEPCKSVPFEKCANSTTKNFTEDSVTETDLRIMGNLFYGSKKSKVKTKALSEAVLELRQEKSQSKSTTKIGSNKESSIDISTNRYLKTKTKDSVTETDIRITGNLSYGAKISKVKTKAISEAVLQSRQEKSKSTTKIDSNKESSIDINTDRYPNCSSLLHPKEITNSDKSETNSEFVIPQIKKRKIDLQNLNALNLPFITQIPFEDLIISEKVLGRGSFGTVKEGLWSGTNVAIKTIETIAIAPKYIVKEVAALKEISHENIVNIMGVCARPMEFHIVMELIVGNTLKEILFNEIIRNKFNLSMIDKHDICKQICKAITFLHMHPRKFIHRDIKPANILVNQEKKVKICDLGLSKVNQLNSLLLTSQGMRKMAGSPIYMAPEVLLKISETTQSSDVWSLACTIVEVYSEKPIWILQGSNPLEYLKNLLRSKQKPSIDDIPLFLKTLISSCFDYEVDKRPVAKTMFTCFKNIYNYSDINM